MSQLLKPAYLWAFFCGLLAILLHHQFFGPKIRRHGKPLRKPRDTLPLVGNGLRFLQARQKLFSWFVKCERQFGYETLQISVPTLPPGVIINDPQNLDYVFKNEGIFGKGEFVKSRSWDLFGHGIINTDGDLWRAQRKAGLHFLNTANLRVLTDVALPQYLSQSVELLEARCDGTTIVDLQAVFHEITTQLMGKMAYNMEMHADDDFTLSFEFASGATAERFQNPLWFLTEIIFGSQMRRAVAIVKSQGRAIVQSAKQDRERAGGSGSTSASKLDAMSGSLVQSLLDALGDEDLVSDAALNYLSAGRDTTAQALTWTFYLLMNHRHSLSKIRNETRKALDASSSANASALPIDSPGAFALSSMPYTLAVFYESLRLYPPIPFEIKQAEKQTQFPDGTFLPKGAVVVWCPWAMNRSRTTWGDDADAFRPERWLGEGNQLISKSASEFPVFNGGPRTCLGKKMAELIAVQVLAVMVERFDFVPAFAGERVSKTSLTLPMEKGLPCLVKRRTIPR